MKKDYALDFGETRLLLKFQLSAITIVMILESMVLE